LGFGCWDLGCWAVAELLAPGFRQEKRGENGGRRGWRAMGKACCGAAIAPCAADACTVLSNSTFRATKTAKNSRKGAKPCQTTTILPDTGVEKTKSAISFSNI
jgi:hypothetical protein